VNSPQLEPLITQAQIAQRVQELAEAISADYHERPLGVMTGSLLFLADLMKQLRVPHQVGVIQASSYAGATTTAGTLRTNLDYLPTLAGRDVLLIDDILDTGKTLQELMNQVATLQPASLKTAVLLWKPERTQVAITPDYLGFSIADQFVVGYGLDYNDDYRHLPHIQTLRF